MLVLLFGVGCKSEQYLLDDPYLGRQYILLENCYIFERIGSSEAKYPLIGCNFPFPGRLTYLPDEVSIDNVGKVFGSAKIVGVVFKGTEFSVVGSRVYTKMTNRLRFYEIQIKDSSQKIDAISILSIREEMPLFHPKIASPKL